MRIHGEYVTVTGTMRDPRLAAQAHATPLTPDEAARLIVAICDLHKITIRRLKFKKGTMGSYTPETRTILLPPDPLPIGQRPYGYLRVGLVIHEMAHVIACDLGVTGHGYDYIEIFERMLVRYYNGDYK